VSETEPKKTGVLGRWFARGNSAAAEADQASPVDTGVQDQPAVDLPADETAQPSAPPPAEQPKNWFQRLRSGLSRTSNQLTEGIGGVFNKRKLDASTLEELEDLLIQADLGVDTAMRITDRLSKEKYNKEISGEEIRQVLAEEVEAVLKPFAVPLAPDTAHKPHVILVVGVNGTGKTTTIGKLARNFTAEGKSVMLAAGDTFRAAAIEQLRIWGERTNSPVISRESGADAAGLVYDAFTSAREDGRDILIVDTAGRLQNKANLMAELEKIVRVIKKQDETAPHTVLLTLDATTGQNALNQVEIFKKTAGVTGLIMTKLDGTARGGILVAIADKHKLPVHAIGVGEGAEDLQPFDARDFARAIAGLS
jgi:fused signal recognition particle receptor